MRSITLAFLWHLHQPLYRLPGERACVLPWVRLHAIRSYYDMVRVLEEFPDLRVTMNLTPVLVEQIGAYAAGGSDLFWDVGATPAADLTPGQRAFLFDHFFAAQQPHMIGALPRYAGLLERRDRARRLRGPVEAWREFDEADTRDLQAFFDLCWFGFKAREDYPALRALAGRGLPCTQDDIRTIHAVEREILGRLLPLYRAAAARGQIEIATSPYAHPILPLLIDSDCAREAMPDATLPSRFRAPGDGRAQIEDAGRFMESALGARPRGMWPSEGSVGRDALALMAECGYAWAATDERILNASERRGPGDAGTAWDVEDAGDIALLFRDQDLSDRIGFTYARLDPAQAAEDFLAGVVARRDADPDRRLVLVALDGENPWEHYPRAGAGFLRALYGAALRTPGVTCATVGAAAAACERHGRIGRLRAGSWINADFATWIGGREKNRAWETLGLVRGQLAAAARGDAPAPRGEAPPSGLRPEVWASLRAAEGSDWFWWFDGQHASPYKAQFDAIFRGHLKAACAAAGLPCPDRLNWPITAPAAASPSQIAEPTAWLEVRVDGFESDFFEWRGAVALAWTTLDAPAAMRRARRPIESVRYGFSRSGDFLLRLDPDRVEGPEVLLGLTLDLGFRSGERARHLRLALDERGDLGHASIGEEPLPVAGGVGTGGGAVHGAGGVDPGAGGVVRAAARKIFELSVPCAAAGLTPGRECGLIIRLRGSTGEEPLREIVLRVPVFTAAGGPERA